METLIDTGLTSPSISPPMGLFDTLAKQAIGSLLGGGGSGNTQSDLLSSLLNQAGGLPGLMQKFNQAGLADAFSSWVSTGANKAIQPDQLKQALGSEAISDVAHKIGLDTNTIMPLLAQFLPQIVDKLTPNGAIENAAPSSDQLQNVVASVMQGGLSSFFGNKA